MKVFWDRGAIEDRVPKYRGEFRSHQATFGAQAVEAK